MAFAFGGLVAETLDVAGLALLGDRAGWQATISLDGVTFEQAPAVALEWGGGLGTLMVAAVVAVLIYSGRGPYRTARLAMLWTLIHLTARGFAQVAAVPITDGTAAARAFEGLGWGDFGTTLAAITAVVALIGLGTLAGAEFAQFSRADFEKGGEVRQFVAWIAGSGVIGGFPLLVGLLWPLADSSALVGGLAAAFVAVMAVIMASWYVNVLTKGTPRRVVSFGLIVITAALAFGIRLFAYQG